MTKLKHTKIVLLLILYILMVFYHHKGYADALPVKLIFNMNSDQSLTQKEVRDIYLGDKTTWPNGIQIAFAVIRKGDVHNNFLDEFIGMNSKNFARYWRRQVLTGKASAIKLLNTEKDVVEYVSMTYGAIGYISADYPEGTLKILNIKKD